MVSFCTVARFTGIYYQRTAQNHLGQTKKASYKQAGNNRQYDVTEAYKVVKSKDKSQCKYRINADMVTPVLLNEAGYTAAGHIQSYDICGKAQHNLRNRIAF
jgi:hypothetical protein